MEAFMGTVMLFGGSFIPRGWLPCDGRLLSISENDALYALLGTTYGGDGVTTFGIPDLRSRVAIGAGQGPGQPNYPLAQMVGNYQVTMTAAQLPAHTHPAVLNVVPVNGTSTVPAANLVLAQTVDSAGTQLNSFAAPQAQNASSSTQAVVLGNAGSSLPIEVMQPFLGIQYIICQFGLFPSRN